MSGPDIGDFRRVVYGFYRHHKRALPWREDITPYRVLVSEIMLQQTQVERVIDKYLPFLSLFPDFPSLASASLRDIMLAWQGLGYNRRALLLKRLSERVVERHGADLPADRDELHALPGVGEATAGAVLAFAFNVAVPFIETNIRRVIIHHFFQGADKISDRQIMPVVVAVLDRENPRDWYWALMDYGSFLGRAVDNPNRRSAHYNRQGPFAGSDRKVRGEVIRALLGTEAMSADDIASVTGLNAGRLVRTLGAMMQDGLVAENRGLYSIV